MRKTLGSFIYSASLFFSFAQAQIVPTKASVKGVVTNRTSGRPAIGAKVCISLKGSTFANCTNTNVHGGYSFSGNISIGSNSIQAVLKGYTTYLGTLTISKAIGYQQNIALTPIPPPAPIASLKGYVTDAVSKKRLAGASVCVSSLGGTHKACATSAGDGLYQFYNSLPLGNYSIQSTLRGYKLYSGTMSIPKAGGYYRDIALSLAPPPALASLKGFVTDAVSRKPLAGASVCVASIKGTFKGCVTAAADGLYYFKSILPVGEYSIQSTLNGYQPYNNTATIPSAGGFTRDIALSLVPPALASLKGFVTDAVSRKPLAGASVCVASIRGTYKACATAGDDGLYHFYLSLPVDEYSIQSTLNGYQPYNNTATIPSAGGFLRDIALSPLPVGDTITFDEFSPNPLPECIPGEEEMGIECSEPETVAIKSKGYKLAATFGTVRINGIFNDNNSAAQPSFGFGQGVNSGFVLTKENQAIFDLVSIDLLEASQDPKSYSLVFVGHKTDGGAVSLTYTLDGRAGKELVKFGADFSNLSKVEILENTNNAEFTEAVQIDNLVLRPR